MTQKFKDFAKFHPLNIQGGQKFQFRAKFSACLKISGFCQFSSFACLQWSGLKSQFSAKFLKWLKILDFDKCHPLQVWSGKKTQFWAKFSTRFLDLAFFPPPQVCSGQKSQFWSKFSKWFKISGLCQISAFAGPEWSKTQFWVKFSKWLQISGFCQMSSFAGPEWSEISTLSQIFQMTQILGFLSNLILCRSGVVKNLIFWAKFSKWLKVSGFYQISYFADPRWSEISI